MMRMLPLPSAAFGCDKVHEPVYGVFAPKQQSPPLVNLSVSTPLKRKRAPTSGNLPDHLDNVISVQLDESSIGQTTNVPPLTQDHTVPLQARETPFDEQMGEHVSPHTLRENASQGCGGKLQKMRQVISSQISLEILLKHKELRLIDQEIAKCQIALEQLRRCSEIPFPATQLPSLNVSEGRGAAVRKPGDRFPAVSPAPWGVVDGPYSRHYAKWLLPDTRFDGGEPEPYPQPVGQLSASGRSTRGYHVDLTSLTKSRSGRGSKLQPLPAGYGQPKEKATGPMILKRKSDGKSVKLVCPDCSRHDFGSAQGFINHCRIGHQRSFASHDAAAEACGELVELDENGAIKGAELVPTLTVSHVHPLIRTAKLESPATGEKSVLQTRFSDYSQNELRVKSAPSSVSLDFTGSEQTPHLSQFVKNQGLGLDLQSLVAEAKSKFELTDFDSDDLETPVESPAPVGVGRHPLVAGSKQPSKSGSSKAPSALLHRRMRMPTSSVTSSISSLHDGADDPRKELISSLLPSPTNDSTQAPSLVDDDEELDPQSPASSGDEDNDEHDDAEVNFEVHDDEHGESVPRLGRGELTSPPSTCDPTPALSTGTAMRRTSVGPRSVGGRLDDNNQLVGPKSTSDGQSRKRRKVNNK